MSLPRPGRSDTVSRRVPLPAGCLAVMGRRMTIQRTRRFAEQGVLLLGTAMLAGCVSTPPKQVAKLQPPAAPAVALPAAPPTQDWRDVPLTPGRWSWHGGAGRASIAQYGAAGQPAQFALRCDITTHAVFFSRAGSLATTAAPMLFTTSFGTFSFIAGNGGGEPPAIIAQAAAHGPHLDQLAFSRGRFLVDVDGQPRLVLPSWPEVARVIEDCRF